MDENIFDAQVSLHYSSKQLGAAVESLLFVSGRPLARNELRKLLAINDEQLT